MSHRNELQQMAVEDLAQRCAQETELYKKGKDSDSSYCFELFRRAIQNNDGQAWGVLILQYQPLVAGWVDKGMDKHADVSSFNEESQDFVAQAFERFWISYTPAKFENAQRSLPAVLKYLQMCVHGAMMDAWRKARRIQIEQEAREEEQEPAETDPTPEDLLQRDEFWRLIREKAKDPKEFKVVYASYYMGFSPREIFEEYPNDFRSIKEIYQHKANFLERLGRDEDLRELFRGR